MSLIEAITDPYWREWARGLPILDARRDNGFAIYLSRLARVIDDAPLDTVSLRDEDRRTLMLILAEHRHTALYELDRVARRARETGVPGALGGLIALGSATLAAIAATVQALLALSGLRDEAAQRNIERQVDRLTAMIDRLNRKFLK